MSRRGATAVALVVALVAVAVAVDLGRRAAVARERCGPGFHEKGPRCCAGPRADGDVCPWQSPDPCPAPLARSPAGCDAPDVQVRVPAGEVSVGPSSDWEAAGRVAPRVARVAAFAIDAFETTVGRYCDRASGRGGPSDARAFEICQRAFARELAAADRARAVRVPFEAARASCTARNARLPTRDEWQVAARASLAGPASRYPWGDTGATCRRAAWGLAIGPCGTFGSTLGSDTVGAHPAGDTPSGIHDLAGNAAEWTAEGLTKGGDTASAAAHDLRVWSEGRSEGRGAPGVAGFRCVSDD